MYEVTRIVFSPLFTSLIPADGTALCVRRFKALLPSRFHARVSGTCSSVDVSVVVGGDHRSIPADFTGPSPESAGSPFVGLATRWFPDTRGKEQPRRGGLSEGSLRDSTIVISYNIAGCLLLAGRANRTVKNHRRVLSAIKSVDRRPRRRAISPLRFPDWLCNAERVQLKLRARVSS